MYNGPNTAQVIQVIKTTRVYGKGTKQDLVRIITEYWSLDGELLASVDPGFIAHETAQDSHVKDQLLLAIERDEETGIIVIRKMQTKEQLLLTSIELDQLHDALTKLQEALKR